MGIALGDGNLSNPNGRAVRLRITCDKKYPLIVENIIKNLKIIFTQNKISITDRVNALDICIYSNDLEKILGWGAKGGSKIKQKVGVPSWIKENKVYRKECLRGLFQTDGSIYSDRGYKMVNFTSVCYTLIRDIEDMLQEIGFAIKARKVLDIKKNRVKYIIRISKNVEKFIKIINFWKL
ncbi:MAG: LAGLIDADG family homing endonuclease [Candidatus Paceibacterota bacterium]|jgi:intein/homing endonuclease